jgi:hypothetical protein
MDKFGIIRGLATTLHANADPFTDINPMRTRKTCIAFAVRPGRHTFIPPKKETDDYDEDGTIRGIFRAAGDPGS